MAMTPYLSASAAAAIFIYAFSSPAKAGPAADASGPFSPAHCLPLCSGGPATSSSAQPRAG